MLTPVPPTECMLARESASARLDGELPELDEARFEAHLRSCPSCSAYAAEVASIADMLRAAPLERPRLEVFGAARAPRRAPAAAVSAAAALLIAVVSGSSFVLGRVLGSQRGAAVRITASADQFSVRQDSAQQHLLAMFETLAPLLQRSGRMRAL